MKNVKLYKWLTVTLMLSISVFCLMYLEKTKYVSAPAVAETGGEKTLSPDVPKPPEKPIYYNVLPRSAFSYNGEKWQNIGGDKDETLKAVHTFNKKTYVFFDTSSNGYDVKTTVPSVACALINSDLTLQKTATLTSKNIERFLSSKITKNGFVVLTKSSDYLALYKMNFDLIVQKKEVFYTAENGALHLLSNGKILTISSTKTSLTIRIVGDDLSIEKSSSLYLSSPVISMIFEKDETLNLFVNLENGFAHIRYSDFFGFLSSDEYPDKKIVDILPFHGGFSGIYQKNGKSYAFTADENMVVANEKPLGEPTFSRIFKSGENLIIVTSENDKSTSTLYCRHLDEVVATSFSFPVKDAPYYDESTGQIALFDGEYVTLYSVRSLDFQILSKYPVSSSTFKMTAGGIVAFSTNKKDGAFNKNFGESDVFITILNNKTTPKF